MNDRDPYGHPRIPFRGYYDKERCALRRQWVERFASCSLEETGRWWDREGEDDSRSCLKLKGNVENLIGLCKIPVGIAGPLLVRGEHVIGYVCCPFATTEGALVASATRGATALTRSGGVNVRVLEQSMTRAPAFQLRSSREAELVWQWMRDNMEVLRKHAHLFSQHADLKELIPYRMGRVLIVEFRFFTEDAAGQNMVTSATSHCCKWMMSKLEKELPEVKVTHFWIESLLSSDKRASSFNQMRTRGFSVEAEAWIPEDILKSVLKTDAKTLLDTYHLFQNAAMRCGQLGFNINVPNTLAAVFIATGQDVACTAESAGAHLTLSAVSGEEMEASAPLSSSAVTSLDLSRGGVYLSLVFPSLVLGTVGGGTNLATQKECLQLLGCYGNNAVRRLSEIVAAFALSLDVSTLAAIASGQFASAHEKLGRNHPTDGLRPDLLNGEFFTAVLSNRGKLVSWNTFNLITGNSILSELTKSQMNKMVGHFGYEIEYKDPSGELHSLKVVVKSKPTDMETSNLINKMAQGCGLSLATTYERHKMDTGFRFCNVCEILVAQLQEPVLRELSPHVYHTICNTTKNVYVMVMEFLDNDHFSLLNTADDISSWTPADIEVVMRDLARLHALFLGHKDWLEAQYWLETFSETRMRSMTQLWLLELKHAHEEFPESWSKERVDLMERAISNIPSIWSLLESAPKTLIHNDCNPRNLCLRCPPGKEDGRSESGDPRVLCIYDWELALIGVPQRDLVEFLAFTLQPTASLDTWLEHIHSYWGHLQDDSHQKLPWEGFLEVFDMACLEFAIIRLLMYTMAHTYKDYMFLPRVINSLFHYITGRVACGGFGSAFKTTAKL